ncbi:hypothetical protein SELMODRAFT_430530 [Selaginella moellendorffii]|uniref:Methyltransferase domain-containing protein n=1 Tax=Selaginella moellendorffii TaxID=88036 RepID=D8T9P5_SELML|nr:hypothetical protein SELMODRAFT_430530 [Selaginella moellendorffii]
MTMWKFLPSGTELFRNPLVSLIYERGWRQNFERSGFPGQLKMALEYLRPAFGGVIVDVSCGSAVIALDFSESMLQQCAEFVKQDKSLRTAYDSNHLWSVVLFGQNEISPWFERMLFVFLLRPEPFLLFMLVLHCIAGHLFHPQDMQSLKPGGVFVATTFLSNSIFSFLPKRRSSSLRYWTEKELEELCKLCGLVDYQKKMKGNYIMLSARKQ